MIASVQPMQDIRDIIFQPITGKLYTADLATERAGVVVGTARLQNALHELGVAYKFNIHDGEQTEAGNSIVTFSGTAKQIALAEEFAIGMLAKPSGIATAANQAAKLAGPEMRIVCGAWKKMPREIKEIVREAIQYGNAAFRIAEQPFLYLDKNFVRMLGGIEATLAAVKHFDNKLKVIQLKGDYGDIVLEAVSAVRNGADVIMVDTGEIKDISMVNAKLLQTGVRAQVKLAFAKGIQLQNIAGLQGKGIDILDIGVSILDAPLLDMKLDVRI